MATMTAMGRDDAAYFTPVFAAAETALTAAGAGDNTEITTAQLDLQTQFGTRRFTSLTLSLAAIAVLAAGRALDVKAVRFQHSDDANTWVDVKPGSTLLTIPGAAAGTYTGAAVIDCNLAEARRYVRAKFTPDLSAGNNDTAKVSAIYILSGASEI